MTRGLKPPTRSKSAFWSTTRPICFRPIRRSSRASPRTSTGAASKSTRRAACAARCMACPAWLRRIAGPRATRCCSTPDRRITRSSATSRGSDTDLGTVESIVLSHGHWDHAGAMLLALGMIRGRNGGRDVPFYAHPGMFHTRGVRQPNGNVRQMEDVPSRRRSHGFRRADDRDHGAAVVSRRVVLRQRRNPAHRPDTSAATRARCGAPPTAGSRTSC